jgi:hypothetical protein
MKRLVHAGWDKQGPSLVRKLEVLTCGYNLFTVLSLVGDLTDSK